MKRLAIALLVISMVGILSAQTMNTSKTIIDGPLVTLTLTGKDSEMVYIPFPFEPLDTWKAAVGTTIPSSAFTGNFMEWQSTGDVGLDILLTYLTAEESDSFCAWIKPLTYSLEDGWRVSDNDSMFVKFNELDVYTSDTRCYLNWTSGKTYTASLSGALWPFPGFVLWCESKATNLSTTAKCVVDLKVWFVR